MFTCLMADQTIAKGNAAFKAIKKLYPRLSQAVIGGQIPERLYAEDLIEEELMEIILNPLKSSSSKGRDIVRDLQRSVRVKPSGFHTLVQILSEENASKELSATLNGNCSYIARQRRRKMIWPLARCRGRDTTYEVGLTKATARGRVREGGVPPPMRKLKIYMANLRKLKIYMANKTYLCISLKTLLYCSWLTYRGFVTMCMRMLTID